MVVSQQQKNPTDTLLLRSKFVGVVRVRIAAGMIHSTRAVLVRRRWIPGSGEVATPTNTTSYYNGTSFHLRPYPC